MDFTALLASFESAASAVLLTPASGDAEMLRVVLFLAVIVGCGSTAVTLLSRDRLRDKPAAARRRA